MARGSDFPWLVAGLFALEFCVLAWAPHDRSTWALENLLSVPLALTLVATRHHRLLSTRSVVLLFVFLGFHVVGSHYTYSLVPVPAASVELFGRNAYDRLVHFLFGLLFLPAAVELLLAALGRRRRALALCLGWSVILSLSTCYELLEWAAAQLVDPEIGMAFVGAQGDVWDAQKDTGLALVGAWLAGGVLAACGWIVPAPRSPRQAATPHAPEAERIPL